MEKQPSTCAHSGAEQCAYHPVFEEDRRRTANILRLGLQRREDTLREILCVLGLPDDFPVEQLPGFIEAQLAAVSRA